MGESHGADETVFRSRCSVPKMDCPSEERLIRMALDDEPAVRDLRFDLDAREIRIWHHGSPEPLLERLAPLKLGARLEDTIADAPPDRSAPDPASEARVLRQLLAINGVMFVVELSLGLLAESTGLIADSLDMFADAMVYGLSLRAVGGAVDDERRAAKLSGWLQLVLALGAAGEVARRAIGGSEPVEGLMIGVASVALLANLACVALLARHREGGAHMTASWIFSTNDALANLGVITAGVLVAITGSAVPDLVIGALVALVVLSGAVRILRLG